MNGLTLVAVLLALLVTLWLAIHERHERRRRRSGIPLIDRYSAAQFSALAALLWEEQGWRATDVASLQSGYLFRRAGETGLLLTFATSELGTRSTIDQQLGDAATEAEALGVRQRWLVTCAALPPKYKRQLIAAGWSVVDRPELIRLLAAHDGHRLAVAIAAEPLPEETV